MDIKRHSTLNFTEMRTNKPISSQITNRAKRYHFDETIGLSRQSLNRKRKQIIEQGRCLEIERNNRLLLSKITEIMGKPKRQFLSQNKRKERKSLNAGYQRKVCQQIQIDNAKLLERIMKQKSQYDYGKRSDRIEKTTRRIKVRRLPHMNRTITNPEMQEQSLIKMERVMRLNNTTLYVKISLFNKGLRIEAKTNSGIVKVIQIPKEEALDFITTECNSNMQNIFDHLSYHNATLFLNGETAREKNFKQQDIEKYYTEGMDYEEIQPRHVQHSSQLPSIHVNQQFKSEEDGRLSI